MLRPFATQSEETIAMAKHCTAGVELRVSSERLILLDAQPLFSPSVLVDMMRPDGLSTIYVLNGESLSADLAHELLGIQRHSAVPLLESLLHSPGLPLTLLKLPPEPIDLGSVWGWHLSNLLRVNPSVGPQRSNLP
ncbi:uncharacterized protein A4U43_C10F5860 [Asparagus officinalis]|uniref:Uncharacterized protein n=1 Tax=Asparagus officinalis TaxID=4686 RepID=A0A5P1E1H0_ASPOF|nr:uncharacterized protein A4U43_C10F5860 [Asparagus officinalis]